ncbi:YdaS family helix-turn-helix protein [Sphingobium fuliginis]|uniref:Helix-turn-helix domain-containing protein n=1 Tax=Sphingobium fuliginis ATCC 27551 TaxID=1208342 RepID=A0A5B8CJP5_SPHSA|nr:YdaS family helix-turn-helix protein [Sphingobium fuliginis]QDC38387.1 helix-turn-helix domain-containing protein [Sphingobium fuliginis ATCC 27551]
MPHDNQTQPWYQEARAAFLSAVRIAKGQVPFAKICHCTQGNVSQLIRRGSLLPGRFVLNVEAATGVSRHLLRPDIYPLQSPKWIGFDPGQITGEIIPPANDHVVCDPKPGTQEKDID